jgi:hypothetical protein
MRYLIINTDYQAFLDWLYAQHPGLESEPYCEQCRVRNETLFGLSDAYSFNLRQLGHEAWDVYVNNEHAQKAWAREHGMAVDAVRWSGRLRRGVVPWISRIPAMDWFPEIFARQVAEYRPDVLVNLAVDGVDGALLRTVKPHVRLLIGQHAAPLPPDTDLGCYDLLLSSLPNLVETFRRQGLHAELRRLAFDPRVLERLEQMTPSVEVSFVGCLSPNHGSRLQLLKAICAKADVELWGPDLPPLPDRQVLEQRYRGPAWALDMYAALKRSKVTLNHHIDMAGVYANNMRMFESTGVGTLLLTDWKENIADLFEPGREVATYRSVDECLEMIAHYLAHESERADVARAGLARTLREHTYFHRMQELSELAASCV